MKLQFFTTSLILLAVLRLSATNDCSGPDQFKCDLEGNLCIPSSWRCDGEHDCINGADEDDCEHVHNHCGPTNFECETSKTCVPKRWRCDGEKDCPDGSDERVETCSNFSCHEDQFTCHVNASTGAPVCIPNHWQCDGQKDCPDGSDEGTDCKQKICDPQLEFMCASGGQCIFSRWRCDHDKDCPDGEDEDNCKFESCKKDEFQCADNRCIPGHWRCDGESDCRDHTDELNCTEAELHVKHPQCDPDHEWRCKDGRCILKAWQCDGATDCEDASDEENCEKSTCTEYQFKCNNTECIQSDQQCNGVKECKDGSDERDCPTPGPLKVLCNSTHEFDCGDGSCIPKTKLCDEKNDCTDGKDEAPKYKCPAREKVTTCTKNPDICHQTCNDSPAGVYCSCYKGYKLHNDTHCKDINECLNPATCSQICKNNNGSYSCKCHDSYILQADLHTCRAVGEHPRLLVSGRKSIREFDLIAKDYRPVNMRTNLSSAVAIDYILKKHIIVWSDVEQEKIYLCQTKETTSTSCKDPLVSERIDTPDGLAVDWVHNLLYWTDTGLDTISVIDMGTKHRKTLIDSGLMEPRAIVVDPSEGVMFWTDWGAVPKIEIAGLDSTHRRAIINKNIMWPNGLAIDTMDKRIFWADAKLRQLNSASYLGNERKLIVNDWSQLKHPFSVAVFEEKLYWTDWDTEGVHVANKFTGSNVTSLVRGLTGLMTVKVYHAVLQPDLPNKCEMHTCSHMCLPSPRVKWRLNVLPNYPHLSHVCACPDDFVLLEDRFTCQAVAKSLSSPHSLSSEVHSTGHLAGTVMAILAFFSLIVTLIGWLVYRHIQSENYSNARPFSFDNPVYRKTTEDVTVADEDLYHSNNTSSFPPTVGFPYTSPLTEDPDI